MHYLQQVADDLHSAHYGISGSLRRVVGWTACVRVPGTMKTVAAAMLYRNAGRVTVSCISLNLNAHCVHKMAWQNCEILRQRSLAPPASTFGGWNTSSFERGLLTRFGRRAKHQQEVVDGDTKHEGS